MSYALVLYFYLLLIVMWLGCTELWLKRGVIILWWTLVKSSLREGIRRIYNQWSKKSMGTVVYMKNRRTKISREKAIIYYAAKDFVHLNFQQKFNVGFQMGFCDHYDAMRDEEQLEEYIFTQVLNSRALDEFMANVRLERARYDEPG